MRAWAWFSLVLSALWLTGFGGWLWISSVGESDEWYAIQLQRCYTRSDIKRERLRSDDGQYHEMIANISSEYYACTERVKAIFDNQMDKLRSHFRNIMAINTGVLAAIWLLLLGGVLMGRRVAADFRQHRA
jgi:hypothetical protein